MTLDAFSYEDYDQNPYKNALIIGKTGGGKSLTARHYLKTKCKHIGKFIAVTGSEGANLFWSKALGSEALVYDANNQEDIDALSDIIAKNGKTIRMRKYQNKPILKRHKLCIIFDDTNDEKVLEKSKIVQKLYTKGRQAGIMVVYLSQTVKNRSSVPPVVRDNSNLVFVVYQGVNMLRQIGDIFVPEIDTDVFSGVCQHVFELKNTITNDRLYSSVVINRFVRSSATEDILSIYIPETKQVIDEMVLNDPNFIQRINDSYYNLEREQILREIDEKQQRRRLRESAKNNPFDATIKVDKRSKNRPSVEIKINPNVFREASRRSEERRHVFDDSEFDETSVDIRQFMSDSPSEAKEQESSTSDDYRSNKNSLSAILGF